MTSTSPRQCSIGDVARRTGVSERTLRYYEELGLLAPARDAGGRRQYDGVTLDRLYRIRLLRELGTSVADLNLDADDLPGLTRRHLVDLDARLADLARARERVRAVEVRLLEGDRPSDEALLDLLSGLPTDEPALRRRVTLLVYRDIAAAHAYLVDVLGLAPGPISFDGDRAVHGEVHAGQVASQGVENLVVRGDGNVDIPPALAEETCQRLDRAVSDQQDFERGCGHYGVTDSFPWSVPCHPSV